MDLERIELTSPQCECGVLPLYYKPINLSHSTIFYPNLHLENIINIGYNSIMQRWWNGRHKMGEWWNGRHAGLKNL